MRCRNTLGRRYLMWVLAFIALFGVGSLMRDAYATSPKKTTSKPARDPYSRPAPSVTQKPNIPSVNRYQPNRVFLEKADSLFRAPGTFDDRQVVKGNVVFRQGGMWMYCDSAYYFQERNSMDAFGHVKMTQGDTLFVYADKLFYDGVSRVARLRGGPTQPQVLMRNRKVSLTTDSLIYDLNADQGWYDCGGLLKDDVNTLTSRQGRYSPSTKEAEFYYDVVLVNDKDGYRLLSDTLYYNTATHIARIVSPTRILSENDTILTSGGEYNTNTGNADLFSRSTIIHRDSTGNVTTLEGDSIVYDKHSGISRAFSYGRFSHRHPRPMVLTDTARHAILIGGYGEYNDRLRTAMASGYPLLKEFSTKDTVYLRADTIRSFLVKRKVPAPVDSARIAGNIAEAGKTVSDSVAPDNLPAVSKPAAPADSVFKDFHVAKAYRRARFFRQDIQGIADSITFQEVDSMIFLDRGPIVWNEERQVSGNRIEVHFNDSTADRALLPDFGLMMEHVDEDFYNQLAGKKMLAFLDDGELRRLEVQGNVQTIFLPQESDSTYNRLVTAESSNMTLDMDGKNIGRLKMWPEVTGDFTPIFLVKRSQKLLPGAVWREELRPQRLWIDTRWSWQDDLGELSPELERYFESLSSAPKRSSSPPLPPMP